MPFYKRANEDLQIAPNFVIGPEFELREESHEQHEYPVDGWYWFVNLDEAMKALVSINTEIVTPRQFRRALLQVGLLETVEAFMVSADIGTRTDWEYAIEIRRDYPGWDQFASAIGKTPADVDAIFALAATI